MKIIDGTKYATFEEACKFLNIKMSYLHILTAERRFTTIIDEDNRRKRLIPFRELELKKEGKLRRPRKRPKPLPDAFRDYLASPEFKADVEELVSSISEQQEYDSKVSEIVDKVIRFLGNDYKLSLNGNHTTSENASLDSLQEASIV